MSDADQGPGNGADAGIPQSSYQVVPTEDRTSGQDLYAFRAEIPPPPPPPPLTPTQAVLQDNKTLLVGCAVGGAILLIGALVAWLVLHQDEPPSYIDLGTSSFAAAGLEGKLIARWSGSARYEMHIDPVSPQQVASFSAVAANPPHALTISIHLKDASSVACQKEILLPFNAQSDADPDHPDSLQPEKSLTGDTIQNIATADGKINEILVEGPLDCPVKAYKTLEAWDISSNFPTTAEQDDWLRHQETIATDARRRAAEQRARALIPKTHPLAAPIEGDDTIVSDNPSHGTVETGAGRVFYLGKDVLREAEARWQVFPVPIHFRCDTKAICTLTRSNGSSPLQSRLVH
jgi:hypothetical protein